jgi:hypothetical protein
MSQPEPEPGDDFARQAHAPRRGFLRELLAFMLDNKKWWLAPILLSLLLLGLLVLASGTAVAPFIYTLF